MLETTCETCGKIIQRQNWEAQRSEHHYCSKRCYYKRYDHSDLEIKYKSIIKMGQDIGRTRGVPYLWHTCESCGKGRWVSIKNGKVKNLRCHQCAFEECHRERLHKINWAGGRHHNTNGYVMVYLRADDKYYPMVNRQGLIPGVSGYVMEHRLILAKSLGRCLTKREVVHHINGIKDDNRIVNLLLVTRSQHREIIPAIQKRVRQLEWELNKLKQMYGIEVNIIK